MSHPLLSLLQLSDPALPIGGYAHSGGLETYVQAGVVRDVGTAGRFVREMLSKNLFYTDAALMALAYKAEIGRAEIGRAPNSEGRRRSDGEGRRWSDGGLELLELDALCEAVKLPKEVRQSSRKLGGRLLKIFRGMGMAGMPDYERAVREKGTPGHYSIVFGYCAATLGVGLREALTGYYYNAAAGMITNCVKLVPIGQQDGQTLLFGLQSLIGELVERTLEPDRDLIGFCCAGLDIRCMQHEHLYSRLYMS